MSAAKVGKVLAVMCHKGGAGKTTTVHSLAALYAKHGFKVLVIDADEQGSMKTLFQLKASLLDGGLGSILLNKLEPDSMIMQSSYENLDVLLSGGRWIRDYEEYAFQKRNSFLLMNDLCKHLKKQYDIILVDTPPSIGAVSLNVVYFADFVLLVAEPDLLGTLGVRATSQFITDEVGGKLKLKIPRILGVSFTRYDARRSADMTMLDEMDSFAAKGLLGGGVVFNPIRQDAKMRMAHIRRKTIFQYAPKSKAAADYAQLGLHISREMGMNFKKLEKGLNPTADGANE